MGPLDDDDVRAARALADIATIGILQQRTIARCEVLTEQLQTALNSGILIDQAEGVLAAKADIDVETAYTRLRAYCRPRNLQLTATASAIARGAPRIGCRPRGGDARILTAAGGIGVFDCTPALTVVVTAISTEPPRRVRTLPCAPGWPAMVVAADKLGTGTAEMAASGSAGLNRHRAYRRPTFRVRRTATIVGDASRPETPGSLRA